MNLNVLLQATPEGAGSSSIIMIILIFVIFYFFMIRPQKKREKEIQSQRSALKAGDKVITSGGIFGKIKEISDNSVVIEIANNVNISVRKTDIYPDPSDLASNNASNEVTKK